MSRLTYSIVLFAVLTGGFSSFSILIEDITLFEIWIIPIGIVIAMNAHHTRTEVAAELDSVDHIGLEEVSAWKGYATYQSRQPDRRRTSA